MNLRVSDQTFTNPFKSDSATATVATAPTPAAASPFAPPANSAPAAAAPLADAVPFGDPTDEVFEFDLTGVSSSNFVGAGTYLLRLADVERGTSRAGNPQWIFSFAVIQNADGTPSSHAGKIVKKFCALTPNALGILAGVLEALYLRKEGESPSFKKSDSLNRLCYGMVEDGEYEGRKTTNLNQLFPYEVNPGAKWSPEGIRL